MKLKTATLLAIIGTAVALGSNVIHSLHNLIAGHIPPVYLLSVGASVVFQVCLLVFFITLHRNQ